MSLPLIFWLSVSQWGSYWWDSSCADSSRIRQDLTSQVPTHQMPAEPPSHCDTRDRHSHTFPKIPRGMILPLLETIALTNLVWPCAIEHALMYVCCGVQELENPGLNPFTTYVTLGKSLNLSGPHLWNWTHRGMLKIKWTNCRSSTLHIVGSHYMATSRQREANYSRTSGEFQEA